MIFGFMRITGSGRAGVIGQLSLGISVWNPPTSPAVFHRRGRIHASSSSASSSSSSSSASFISCRGSASMAPTFNVQSSNAGKHRGSCKPTRVSQGPCGPGFIDSGTTVTSLGRLSNCVTQLHFCVLKCPHIIERKTQTACGRPVCAVKQRRPWGGRSQRDD